MPNVDGTKFSIQLYPYAYARLIFFFFLLYGTITQNKPCQKKEKTFLFYMYIIQMKKRENFHHLLHYASKNLIHAALIESFAYYIQQPDTRTKKKNTYRII